MSEDFQLEVRLSGPERSLETHYGPRTERDLLAHLDVPVSSLKGWTIYQEAVRASIQPDLIITFPEGMTAQEAERFRAIITFPEGMTAQEAERFRAEFIERGK